MRRSSTFSYGVAALAIIVALAASQPVHAQTSPSAPVATELSDVTIKGLQEALNKQGIAVAVDGVLNDATREAIRKYQSQHHLPVTGNPDTATLGKLGVAARRSEGGAPVQAQGTPQGTTGQAAASPPAGGAMAGMMNCPMMSGQMQSQMQAPVQQQQQMMAMMQMMQGMMQMMQSMHGQMQPGQMGPGQTSPRHMGPGQMGPRQGGNSGSGSSSHH